MVSSGAPIGCPGSREGTVPRSRTITRSANTQHRSTSWSERDFHWKPDLESLISPTDSLSLEPILQFVHGSGAPTPRSAGDPPTSSIACLLQVTQSSSRPGPRWWGVTHDVQSCRNDLGPSRTGRSFGEGLRASCLAEQPRDQAAAPGAARGRLGSEVRCVVDSV